jgi:hypothetical protein
MPFHAVIEANLMPTLPLFEKSFKNNGLLLFGYGPAGILRQLFDKIVKF